jgi:hypothetical protein
MGRSVVFNIAYLFEISGFLRKNSIRGINLPGPLFCLVSASLHRTFHESITVLSAPMNLFDPFFLFCGVEFVAVVALLVVWLDVGLCGCYIALSSHVTPELLYLQFPKLQEMSPAGVDPTAGIAPKAAPEVGEIGALINAHAAANDRAFKTLVD